MPIETPLRAENESLGAKFGKYFGCALPEDYGDAAREYRFARETVGLVDKNYRATLSLTGADQVRYLNAMLTNNIRDLAPGQGNVSLLLNPQGHILAEVATLRLEDRLLAISHAMARERLVTTLEKFIIMDEVTLEDITDRTGTLALQGPKTREVMRALCGLELDSLAELGHIEKDAAGVVCRILRRSTGNIPGAEFMTGREHLSALWNLLLEAARRHGGGPVGYEALNALRLEAGIPWFGDDFDENQIPHQAALEETHISFVKGCYTGQEIVERVRSRGHVNRRRASLSFPGTTVPPRGAALFAEGKEVGHITSAAQSPSLGQVIGMGYLRREYIAPGSEVQWEGGPAIVIELPVAPRAANAVKTSNVP